MAGRFLLIEFDDEASANALRAQIDNATRKGKRFRVIGLYSRPGPTFCRCGKWINSKTQKSTLKRGQKFGWEVCTVCKKPAPIMSFLKNLLKPEEIIDPPLTEVDNRSLMFYNYGLSLPTRARNK